MTIDPNCITEAQLCDVRHNVARGYGIDLYRQYTERQAADLLVAPGEREEGGASTSTLKRKRRAGKIPHVPRGDGRIAYLGLMLADFIAFGERSVLLWGGGQGGSSGADDPRTPQDGPAPSG